MTSKPDIPLRYIPFSRLRAFAKVMNPNFNVDAKHIKIMAQALEDVEEGKIKRLMIWMPPRHGKSMLVSELFPPWYLGRNPSKSIIFTTYSQELASNFGRKVRNHMVDDNFKEIFPTTIISDDSNAANRFHTTQNGVYYAVGAGASITGRGGHVLVIDDPIKGREDADSSLMRQKIKDWFSSVAYTRLEPDGAIVIVQTRWHNDDLSGWLLKQKKEEWTIIDMPAISKDDAGNEVALWPDRFSLERLNEIRGTLHSRDWAALYMQRPIQDGGNVFKEENIMYYDLMPSHNEMNIYVVIDPANSKDKNSDNTCILVVGANKDKKIYLLDAWVDKMNLKERETILFNVVERYNPKMVFYEKYGMQLDIDYMRQAMEHRNYRFGISEVGGSMPKVDRIKRLEGWFEDKRIYFPKFMRKANYLGREIDLVTYFKDEEYLQFPVAQHDDMIDALSRICDINMMFPNSSTFNYHDLYKNV